MPILIFLHFFTFKERKCTVRAVMLARKAKKMKKLLFMVFQMIH